MTENEVALLLARLRNIDSRMESIEKDVKAVLAFKWQIIGGSVVLSLFLTIIMQILLKKLT